MKKDHSISVLFYIFRPVFSYILVSELTAAVMDLAWDRYIQNLLLQNADAALFHTIVTLWSLLRLLLSAGAGCLSVAGEAKREWPAFAAAQKKRRLLYTGAVSAAGRNTDGAEYKGEEKGTKLAGKVPCPQDLYAVADERFWPRTMPLLLASGPLLALGINLFFSCLNPDAGSPQTAGNFPGPAGIVLQAVVYCFFMPFVEETVFRGILYPRLQRGYGTGAALVASAAFFGIYHGNLPQGIYAFFMGIVFAAAYEATGRFTVPCVLHGACNLIILLLQWTDLYRALCRPAWAALFTGAAVCGFFTILLIIKKTAE